MSLQAKVEWNIEIYRTAKKQALRISARTYASDANRFPMMIFFMSSPKVKLLAPQSAKLIFSEELHPRCKLFSVIIIRKAPQSAKLLFRIHFCYETPRHAETNSVTSYTLRRQQEHFIIVPT